MKYLITLIFNVLLLVLVANGQSNNTYTDVARQELSIEQFVYQKLETFFQKDKFIVDVKLTQKADLVPVDNASIQDDADTGSYIDYLPGVPVDKDQLSAASLLDNKASVIEPRTMKSFNKAIVVYLDAFYNRDALRFVEQLIKSSVDLDFSGGDRLSVQSQVFPKEDENSPEAQLNKPYPPQYLPYQYMPPPAQPQVNTQSERSLIERIQQPLPNLQADNSMEKLIIILSFIVGLTLLILVFIFLLTRTRVKDKKDQLETDIQALRDEIRNLGKPSQSSSIENKQSLIDYEEVSQLAQLRSFATKQFINHPDVVARLLKSWLAEDRNSDVNRTADLIASINSKLLSFVQSHFDPEDFIGLEIDIQERKRLSTADQIRNIDAFKRNLRTNSERTQKDEDIFHFLKQLGDNQIIQILRDESDEMSAILLAQLLPERCMKILANYEFTRRAMLIQKIGGINHLPTSVYKEIATYFSGKALQISDMKYVALDGIKTIVNLLNTLNTGDQKAYIDDLAKFDIELAKKIKKQFITFDELSNMKGELLEKYLIDVSPEVIAKALINADKEIVDKILESKPKREQLLIKSEMEFNKNLDEELIESARKILIGKVKQTI